VTTRRILAALTVAGFLGLALYADVPLHATWDTSLSLGSGSGFTVEEFCSTIAVDVSTEALVGLSFSEFHEFGFLWQELSLIAGVGAVDVRTDALFGPSTTDYLYAQAIAEMRLGGAQIGIYYAQVSDAILGGWADGFALRLAGSAGGLYITSITELGARIADDDFAGFRIFHAPSGFSRRYATDPIVAGQGFTGEKLTVEGLSFGCVDLVETTLYLTCAGFQSLAFEIEGLATGISWLAFDLELTFAVAEKTIAVSPALLIGDVGCVALTFDVVPETATISIDGIALGGFDMTYAWNGVTVRDVTVLAPCRYAISTPAFGSTLVAVDDALADGIDHYPDYWELLSIHIDGDACCGGAYALLCNAYFEQGAGQILGWAMTYLEGSVGIGTNAALVGHVTLDAAGLDTASLGFTFVW